MRARGRHGKRTKVVSIRFHPNEVIEVQQKAVRHGQLFADYVRNKALEQELPSIPSLPPVEALQTLRQSLEEVKQLRDFWASHALRYADDAQDVAARLEYLDRAIRYIHGTISGRGRPETRSAG